MTKTIIAIDPGHETGWATGVIEDREFHLERHAWHPWKHFALGFHKRMMEDPYDIVVYESWILRAKEAKSLVGSDMQSSQAIGAMKLSVWLAQQAGARVELVTQHPANKTPANAWIEKFGLWLPKSEVEHNRDAIRHLYFYAVVHNLEVIPHDL